MPVTLMTIFRPFTHWMGAYSVAAVVGYALASAGVTAHNLLRLQQVGADIGAGQALSTFLFDFQALSPTFATITKYGSVIFLGFVIGFAAAHLLHVWLATRLPTRALDSILFPLAGATAMAVGMTLMDATYDVSMVSGTSGISGFLTQCLSGAIAGFVFVTCLRSAQTKSATS